MIPSRIKNLVELAELIEIQKIQNFYQKEKNKFYFLGIVELFSKTLVSIKKLISDKKLYY